MKNKYEIRGNIVAIFINHKNKIYETIIDIDDFNWIKDIDCKWYLNKSGNNRELLYAYAVANIAGKRCYLHLHRLILGLDNNTSIQVDHINSNGLDNRKSNLRKVTMAENMQNWRTQKNNSSGILNVYWDKRTSTWRVSLRVNRKSIYGGYFKNIEDAEKKAIEMRALYFPFSKEADKYKQSAS